MWKAKVGITLIVVSVILYALKYFITSQLGSNVTLYISDNLLIRMSAFKLFTNISSITFLILGVTLTVLVKTNQKIN